MHIHQTFCAICRLESHLWPNKIAIKPRSAMVFNWLFSLDSFLQIFTTPLVSSSVTVCVYSTSFSIASFPCFSTSLLDFYFFFILLHPLPHSILIFIFLVFTRDSNLWFTLQEGALTTYQRIILSTLVYFSSILLFSPLFSFLFRSNYWPSVCFLSLLCLLFQNINSRFCRLHKIYLWASYCFLLLYV